MFHRRGCQISVLMQMLKDNNGDINVGFIDSMINEFGNSFIVRVIFYNHSERLITLTNINKLEIENKELFEDIKHVSLTSDSYERMFG